MSDHYLWDRSGPPDPEIQRLENLLGGFRSQRPAPPLGSRPRWRALGAAAALVAGGVWLSMGGAPEDWQVSRPGGGTSRLAVGQTLETLPGAQATIHIGNVGIVDIEPDSRLRLERASPSQQRMSLEHGLIHAFIWAVPRTFVVDTPSAVATDLGCFYTLAVDKDGSGLLNVLAGWVSLKDGGRESFIPAGASCRTRPGYGPGTPYREETSPVFGQALQDFDFAAGGGPALDIVMAQAIKPDALTLWHLLTRADSAHRPRVYDALAALVPPPADVTREGILRGDRQMLDRWWDQLGLGNAGWWRQLAPVKTK